MFPQTTRLILLAFVFSFLTLAVSAQTTRDVIYLKNGSIVKGQVREMIPGEKISIETADGSVFVFQMAEVLKMEKEAYAKPSAINSVREAINRSGDIRGCFTMIGVSPFFSTQTSDGPGVIPFFIGGYQVNKYFSLGAGVETATYKFQSGRETNVRMTPVFLDMRFYIPTPIKVGPYFNLQGGYSIASNNSALPDFDNSIDFAPKKSNGAFFSVGAGIKVSISKGFTAFAGTGFSVQHLNGYESYYDYSNSNGPAKLVISSTTLMPISMRVNFGIAYRFTSK